MGSRCAWTLFSSRGDAARSAANDSSPVGTEGSSDPVLRCEPPCLRTMAVACVVWMIAMGVALTLDPTVSRLLDMWNTPTWLESHGGWLMRAARAPGYIAIYVPVLIALCFVPRWKWRAALLLAIAAVNGAIAYSLLKWSVGRYRPFVDQIPNPHPYDLHTFPKGLSGLLVSPPNLCFPSGHATMAFAAMTSMGMVFPRWRWVFWSIAVITGIARIVEGAHYASDVIAGVAVGITMAILARGEVLWLCRRIAVSRKWGTFSQVAS